MKNYERETKNDNAYVKKSVLRIFKCTMFIRYRAKFCSPNTKRVFWWVVRKIWIIKYKKLGHSQARSQSRSRATPELHHFRDFLGTLHFCTCWNKIFQKNISDCWLNKNKVPTTIQFDETTKILLQILNDQKTGTN